MKDNQRCNTIAWTFMERVFMEGNIAVLLGRLIRVYHNATARFHTPPFRSAARQIELLSKALLGVTSNPLHQVNKIYQKRFLPPFPLL